MGMESTAKKEDDEVVVIRAALRNSLGVFNLVCYSDKSHRYFNIVCLS